MVGIRQRKERFLKKDLDVSNNFKTANKITDNQLRDVFISSMLNPLLADELLEKLASLKPIDRVVEKNVRCLALAELEKKGLDTSGIIEKSGFNSIGEGDLKTLFMLAMKLPHPDINVLQTASTYIDKNVRGYAIGRIAFKQS